METNKASGLNWGHIIVGTIFVLIFVMLVVMHTNANGLALECSNSAHEQLGELPLSTIEPVEFEVESLVSQNEVEAGPKEEVIVEEEEQRTELDDYITTYLDDIKFLCYTFSIKSKDFIDDLYKRYEKYHEQYGFNEKNVGYILNSNGNLKNYTNVKYGLVEYINVYIDKNPKKKKTRKVSYTGNATYVENLIKYYSSIYTNVDTNIALSIGAAESGYYKVKGMLRAGNVYGGMGRGGLIHYDNIEIGVLSYIRLLSKSYFGKGLKTIPAIGYRYCPTIDNNGNKIASPHWINLVNTAMKKYKKQGKNVSAKVLLGKKEVL